MTVFIWERIEQCTENYHSEGGVVAIAKDEERARELVNQTQISNKWGDLSYTKIEDSEKPDAMYWLHDDEEEAVFLFPDAGCC